MKSKILLSASIAAGLLSLIFVQAYIKGQKGSRIEVFRTTASIKAGERIGGRMETVTLPGDKLFPNILKEAPSSEMRDFVANTPALVSLAEGQLVLYRHLENTVDPGVKTNIPVGKKALSIPVDEATSVSFMVQPEDLVDVLATVPVPTAVEGGGFGGGGAQQRGTLVNKPIVQAIPVLAVGGRYRRADPGLRSSFSSVTLLVTLKEAQKLAYVRDVLQADMTLILRGPEDTEREPQIRPLGLGSPDFDQIGNR